MPSWINISSSDLSEARASKLVDAMATKALGASQPDPTPATISKVAQELRAAIAFSGRYQIDASIDSIPASLKDLAVERIIRLLKGRLMINLTDTEREEDRLYQKRLEQLTQGKWPVEIAGTPAPLSPVQAAGAAQVISTTTRRCTRSTLSGY